MILLLVSSFSITLFYVVGGLRAMVWIISVSVVYTECVIDYYLGFSVEHRWVSCLTLWPLHICETLTFGNHQSQPRHILYFSFTFFILNFYICIFLENQNITDCSIRNVWKVLQWLIRWSIILCFYPYRQYFSITTANNAMMTGCHRRYNLS